MKGLKKMIKITNQTNNNDEKLKGIDISEFNGDIDFNVVKNEVDFIIIRATFGRFGIDKKFKRNAEGCMKYNIPFGFYYYSYALNEEEGKEEVQFFIKNIEKYIPFVSFPCFIDMEDSDNYKQNHGNPSNEVLAKICENAIKELNNKQVFAGIYASYDYFKRKLNFEKCYCITLISLNY